MPVPPFDFHGVLPPFLGASPAMPSGSPYLVTPAEVVVVLGTTQDRLTILEHWLEHRALLRSLGVVGFQWLDGSFVERKNPNDLDSVTFLRRPPQAKADVDWGPIVMQHRHLFHPPTVKGWLRLDAYFVDMDGTAEALVEATSYWFGLFSHRRTDFLRKGMLKVNLEASTVPDDLARVEVSIARATVTTP